jgi:hypothetical protein
MQSVSITTKVVSLNATHGEVYSIQHNVLKFVIDLWQVNGFLRQTCSYVKEDDIHRTLDRRAPR